MSKTKSWLMDMEEEFYAIANNIVGECEAFNEFVVRMKPHYPKMYAFYNEMEIEEHLAEAWNDKWSEYQYA